MCRNIFDEFLRKLLDSGDFSDILFTVHGCEFHVHKCILSARCIYFCQKFENKWRDRNVVIINNDLVKPNAFQSIMQYIYTGRLETQIDMVDDCIRLAIHCKLLLLEKELRDMEKRVTSYACTKPGTHIKVLLLESDELSTELQQDLGVLAVHALPPELRPWAGGSDLPHMPTVPPHLADICFVVKSHKFYCHKVFFCGRSEYFNALLKDHFCECQLGESGDIPMIKITGISVEAFAAVVFYIYTDDCVQVPDDQFLEVLYAADMYLLPGLKRLCGSASAQIINRQNVISFLKAARLFQLPQMENHCTKFIANNIEKVLEDPSLHELILNDAEEVQERQETDTISVIDDIRYHITSDIANVSEMGDAQEKLNMIDKMLENLGLDA